ncbi:MAG: chemotaxis protein CheW, partial [Desulfuromonas sp.]
MTEKNVEASQFVTFQLGEELFGVKVHRTREVLNLISITSVPQTPDYMLGVINLRGQVVPVIDMRCKLGMPTVEASRDTCIVVLEVMVEDEPVVVGAQADAVREVLEIREDQIEPAPKLGSRLKTEFIHGMGRVDD